MKKPILLLKLLLWSSCVYLHAQQNQGPRLTAMGNNTAAVNDIWNVEGNISGLTAIRSPTAAINYGNLFLDKDISEQAIALILPFKSNFIGLSMQRYGLTEFNEIKVGLAFAKKFGKELSIGIKANYHQLKISNYGAIVGLSADVGLSYQWNENLRLGLYLTNLAKQKYNNNTLKDNIPSTLYTGAAYQIADKVLIATTIIKEFGAKTDIGFGLAYQPLALINIRGGLTMKPFKQYTGIGITHKKLFLDFALAKDPNLGYLPQTALAYAF